MYYRFAILFFISQINGQLFARAWQDTVPKIRVVDINPRYIYHNDSVWMQSGICKPLKIVRFSGTASGIVPASGRNSFLKIQGNIQYDFLYRSFADTPFYQKDFRQHTLRTSLVIYAKDKYPMRVNFLIRKSNSPYFRDFFDGGFQFDKHAYLRNIKQAVLQKIIASLPNHNYLDAAKKLLERNIQQYNTLRRKLSASGLAQELIEERERAFFKQMQQPKIEKSGIKEIDSLKGEMEALVGEKKKQLDSLKQVIDKLGATVDSIQQGMNEMISKAGREINTIKSPAELAKLAVKYGVESQKGKFDKFVTNVKSIGIGRSVLDYSELTARNVSLTGLNLEYNSRMYFAVAAGKIDYGFRDFFGKSNRSMNQHLIMGRVGWGDIEKRAVILSVFTGRKANYGTVLSDTVTGNIGVTGYSIEAIIKRDEKTFFSVEVAKSTRPVTGSFADNKELNSLFRFSDQSNIGISAAGQTEIRSTDTKLSGLFRKTGENFQSFSLFTYNTDQTAWMIKAEQPLFKNKVFAEAAVRRNDFVNPFTEKTFKTTTVFGSARLSIRIPKWPSLSVGYHPGSQLYIIDRNRVRENVYYILNGSVIHQYTVGGVRMVSSAIYNNYTTKGTDSVFINYSGRNYMLSQSVYFRRLQLQGNIIYTDQQELRFYTAESNLEYAVKTVLKIGAGVKYNKIISGNTYWGGSAQLILDFQHLGSLQLQYEKSFLPTIQQTLFPVEIGRLTWLKNF